MWTRTPKVTVAVIVALLASAGCHSSPPAPPLPPAAQATIDKLKAACKAGDYPTIRSLMEPTVLTEASIDAAAADTVISDWQGDTAVLPAVAGALDAGCQVVGTDAQVVACPGLDALPRDDADAETFVVAIRPGTDGTWRVYEALYAD